MSLTIKNVGIVNLPAARLETAAPAKLDSFEAVRSSNWLKNRGSAAQGGGKDCTSSSDCKAAPAAPAQATQQTYPAKAAPAQVDQGKGAAPDQGKVPAAPVDQDVQQPVDKF